MHFKNNLTGTIKRLINFERFCSQVNTQITRFNVEKFLATFSCGSSPLIDGPVLVEAMWDNPNFWFRYALVRKALGLAAVNEIALIDSEKNPRCRSSFRRFGVQQIYDLVDGKSDMSSFLKRADDYLAQTRTPEDVLKWSLPYGFPASFIYDGILKRQRSAVVNLADPNMRIYVADALACLDVADRVTSLHEYKLALVTHVVNFKYAALAWVALCKKIPVMLLFGNYGVPRFVKMTKPSDIFNSVDRSRLQDINGLSLEQRKKIVKDGRAYLEKRVNGETDDIGSEYAFRKAVNVVSKKDLCDYFSWDPEKPLVGVYASNWFDYPHAVGMTYFRDFLDWIEITLSAARKRSGVNWLFKAHPCDQWYGGITLKDIISDCEPHHIKLAPLSWNGKSMMTSLDAVITCHGTVGIEFAAHSKPVLLSDVGWYHDVGIGLLPQDRNEYVNFLHKDWWLQINLEKAAEAALIFSGIYFAAPSWQGNFRTEDDSKMGTLWKKIPGLLQNNPDALKKEIEHIQAWFFDKHPFYNTYKMIRSSDKLIV